MTTTGSGVLLDGRYQLAELLGSGGMAEVYRAWDVRLHRPVAIKLFRSAAGSTAHRRFAEEATTLSGLSHPGLVTVYDSGTTADDVPFLVLHLIDGRTLRDRVADGPMSPDEVRILGAHLADALAYVHAQRIVHRDVKPSNVLLDGEMRPFLADFGIARLLDATRYTATGELVGTAGYLAPEQVRGAELGCPCDVYALGLVLLECLTGQREYGGSDVEAAVARLNRPIRVPENVPPDLATLLSRMTALTPKRRPTAERCAQLLRDPGQSPTAVTEMPSAAVAVPAASRRRARWGLVAAVVAVLAAGATVWTLAKPTPPDSSTPPPATPSVDTSGTVTPTVTVPSQVPPPVERVTVVSTVVQPVAPAPPPVVGQDKQPGDKGNGSGTKARQKKKEQDDED